MSQRRDDSGTITSHLTRWRSSHMYPGSRSNGRCLQQSKSKLSGSSRRRSRTVLMNPHSLRIVPADSLSSRKQGFALSITLNCWIVLILDAGLPPMIEEFLEQAEGRACYAVFSIFMGFDNWTLHPDSRDYTTFQTPLGLYQLT